MFGIDGTEFFVIILVAAVVIGPKDMPKMLRAFAGALARMRALAQEFRGALDEALRHADMRETAESLRGLGDSVKELDPRRKLQEFYAALERETAEEHERRRLAEAELKAPGRAAPQAGVARGLDAAARAAVEGLAPLFPAAAGSAGADTGNAAENGAEAEEAARRPAAGGIARHPLSGASAFAARQRGSGESDD